MKSVAILKAPDGLHAVADTSFLRGKSSAWSICLFVGRCCLFLNWSLGRMRTHTANLVLAMLEVFFQTGRFPSIS